MTSVSQTLYLEVSYWNYRPHLGSYLYVESEVVRVNHLDTSGHAFVVQRGLLGTVAVNHPDGSIVKPVKTYKMDFKYPMDEVQGWLMMESVDLGSFLAGEILQIDEELVSITYANFSNFTIVRGVFNTTASSHANSTIVPYLSTSLLMQEYGFYPGQLSIEDEIIGIAATPVTFQPNTYVKIDEEFMLIRETYSHGLYIVERGAAGTMVSRHSDGAIITKVPITVLNQSAGLSESQNRTSLSQSSFFCNVTEGIFIQIEDEIVQVLRVESPFIFINRGQAGSIPRFHPDKAIVSIPKRTFLLHDIESVDRNFTIEDVLDAEINDSMYIQVDKEIMYVEYITGNLITVLRAQKSTDAAFHAKFSIIIAVRRSYLNMNHTLDSLSEEFTVYSAATAGILPGSNLILGNELLFVKHVNGNVLTASRGMYNSSVENHHSGAKISTTMPLVSQSPTSDLFATDGWDQTSGLLSVRIQSSLMKNILYSFSVPVLNPTTPQVSVNPELVLQCGSVVLQAMMSVDNNSPPLQVDIPSFTVKSIRQSTPYPEATNVIRVEFALNFQSAHPCEIILSGLLGSTTVNDYHLPVEPCYPEEVSVFESEATWRQESGTITLRVKNSSVIEASKLACFVFNLTNPPLSQNANDVYITLSDGKVAVEGKMETDVFCIPSSGASQLSENIPDAVTTILHVISSADFDTGNLIYCDNELMVIIRIYNDTTLQVSRGHGGSRAGCHNRGAKVYCVLLGTQEGDCQPLKTLPPGFVLRTIEQSTFYADVSNRITVQMGTNVDLPIAASITIKGLKSSNTADTPFLPIQYTRNVSTFGPYGVWTQSEGSLILSLSANGRIERGKIYSFSFALRNPQLLSEPKYGIGHSPPDIFISSSGSQTLPPTIMSWPEAYPCVEHVSVISSIDRTQDAIEVSNTSSISAGYKLKLENEVMRVIRVENFTIWVLRGQEETLSEIHFEGSLACVVVPGARSGYARPFLIVKPGISAAFCSQLSSFQDSNNTISLIFASSMLLTSRQIASLTVTGLSDLTGAERLPVRHLGGKLVFEDEAELISSSGELVLRAIADLSWLPYETTWISFDLINPTHSVLNYPVEYWFRDFGSSLTFQGVFVDPQTLQLTSLSVKESGFLIKKAYQDNALPSSFNNLTIELSYSLRLQAATLTLHGLTGAQTPDDDSLPIIPSPESQPFLPSTARWNQSSGQLTITCAAEIPAGATITFQFMLRNPPFENVVLDPLVEITTPLFAIAPTPFDITDLYPCIGKTSLKFDVSACSMLSVEVVSVEEAQIHKGALIAIDKDLFVVTDVLGERLGLEVEQIVSQTTIYRAGTEVCSVYPRTTPRDRTPLRTLPRGFQVAKIAQDNPNPGSLNRITVTLLSNVLMEVGGVSTVVLSGFRGTAVQVPSVVALGDDSNGTQSGVFDHKGTWNESDGSLTLTIAEGKSIMPGRFYSFYFFVTNPPSPPLQSPDFFLSATCTHSDSSVHYQITQGNQTTAWREYNQTLILDLPCTVEAFAAFPLKEQSDSHQVSFDSDGAVLGISLYLTSHENQPRHVQTHISCTPSTLCTDAALMRIDCTTSELPQTIPLTFPKALPNLFLLNANTIGIYPAPKKPCHADQRPSISIRTLKPSFHLRLERISFFQSFLDAKDKQE
eukprot:764499-Hanusia_phi.AAC.10